MKRPNRYPYFAAFLLGAAASAASCAPDAANDLRGRASSHDNDSTSGSSGSSSTSNREGGVATADPKVLFTALEPDLAKSCGGTCHEDGSGGAPMWLKGPDAYATVKAYPGIVSATAAASILLTKGGHEGPAMGADLTPRVKAWLDAEVAAKGGTGPIETSDVALPNGATSLDLPGNLGGKLTFTASTTGGVLQLKSVAITAAGASGIHVAGVHVVLTHADATVTTDESFAGADVTVGKGATAPLDVGLVILPHVVATDTLRFAFDELEASTATGDGGTTTPTGGCKSVTSFQTNAAPVLVGTCTGCHGTTNGSGFGALDLTGLTAATPDYARACAQSKNRINPGTPAQSDIILAPTGGVVAHPFRNASSAFVSAMTTWITAEK